MYKWCRLIYLFTLLLVMGGQSYAQPVLIDDSTKEIFLNPYAKVLLDENHQYTIDDILHYPEKRTFYSDINPFGSEYDKTLWLKFDIAYASKDDHYWIIEFQPSTLRNIDAYLVDQDNKILSTYVYRSDIAFADQPTYYRNPILKIYIESKTKPTLYLRVDNSNGILRDMTLWSPYAFIENSATLQLVWGGVFGLYIVLILVSWWFERAVKDGVYGAFTFYVAICACIDLQLSGWWKQIFFPAKNMSAFPLLAITFIWLTYAAVNFFFKYVEVNKTKPVTSVWIIRSLFFYCLMSTLATAFVSNYQMIKMHSFVNTFLILPLCIWFMWKPAWHSRSEIKRTFLYISLIFIATYIYSSLGLLGFYKRNNTNSYAITFATMLVFLLIYYSLSKKYQIMREEKEKAHHEILTFIQNTESYLKEQVLLKTAYLVETQSGLKQSLEKKREAYREQRNFIGMISSELQSPLSVINNAVQNLMGNQHIIAAGIANKIEKINIASKRLSILITDYLNNDRMDAFSTYVESNWITLYPIFEDAIMMTRLMSAKQKYSIDLQNKLYKIWADEDLLKLVIRTLIENASKYTPAGTEIHLSVSESECGWIISVKDNGPGIPDDEKDRIFDRYFRGKSAVKFVGTGLGLSLAKHLIELQHGWLALDDTVQTGCTFNLFLPYPPIVPVST